MDKMIDLINQGGTGEYDARQERGEAVAWKYTALDGRISYVVLTRSARTDGWTEIPLYAHPAPDASREREAKYSGGLAAIRKMIANGRPNEALLGCVDGVIAALAADKEQTK